MSPMTLGDLERAQLTLQHKKERDGRIRDRIKAVLLHDKGWSLRQIAEALLSSDEAVRNHLQDYDSSRKLRPENGGSKEKLSRQQSERLELHLQKHTYLYVKDIIAYVEAVFEISYTVRGLRDWLQRHGFSYKKPAIVPGKANKEQQEKWLVEYNKLRQELPTNETICFIDGVHPTHNVQPAYGWIKIGVRKEIPANTGRSRLNLSGSIDVITHEIVIQEDQTLNAESTIRFFQKIEEAYPNKWKIHVFCDNAPYYRNKAVKNYLETSKIHLHFLPAYSPNLNPIERLWKWMKERVIYNTYYEYLEDFKDAVFGFFTVLSSATVDSIFGQMLRSRVRDKFRPIQAPVANF
ncbi:IS630 family transposase [Simkania negevensis]|uniref:Putative transposase n=1 Tax=Simkania negevensis (strain ATCC VR-1471 / DSM 27360 / Z) TaxID=331113 RepID=F8L3A4_SIMNZ|nr:IS630 family transposase [Simkania negevensis]CCB89742.1 putative transposase [Simkania negevensis Z]